jgi:peptide/nickel transport system permease protein
MFELRILVSRLAGAAGVALGVSSMVFLLLHCVPGDPVDVMLGEYAAAADRLALRNRLGLDLPLLEQWWHFVRGVLSGDLGVSLVSGVPVLDLLSAHFAYTALLAVAALLLALVVGVPLGVLAALRVGRAWDSVASVVAVLGMSLPSFVLGPLLIIAFAVQLRWLPVGGAEHGAGLVLPAVTLASGLAAVLTRMTRAAMLDALQLPHVQAARARGLGERAVVLGHVCRNAALPVVTVLALQLGALLGGAVVTETVFNWPGLGQLLVDAIARRDYPVVQGAVLLIALTYIVLNTLVDFAYPRLDPRIAITS